MVTEAERFCKCCNRNVGAGEVLTSTQRLVRCRACTEIVGEVELLEWVTADTGLIDDMPAIDSWLESLADLARFERNTDGEGGGEYSWRLTGHSPLLRDCPASWHVEIQYHRKITGMLGVRLATYDDREIEKATFDARLVPVAAEFGLQPTVYRCTSVVWPGTDADELSPEISQRSGRTLAWGVRQYLDTTILTVGLFEGVVKRMVTAMRAADAAMRL